jgi:hypothetical protein
MKGFFRRIVAYKPLESVSNNCKLIADFAIRCDCYRNPGHRAFGQGCAKLLVQVQDWLSDRELDLDWLGCGLPESLHLDNAQEFKSVALERGTREYGLS